MQMRETISIGGKLAGEGQPTYIIAEAGINHNGDIKIAKRLIDAAVFAGCDAIKFQKRTPELCVPEEQRDVKRDTPWGRITYMKYREQVEFGKTSYREIVDYCNERGIHFMASAWDVPSLEFVESLQPAAHKIPSAHLTNRDLLMAARSTQRPVILSSGMSTYAEIIRAVMVLDHPDYSVPLVLMHCTSIYPCPPKKLNLRMIKTLGNIFPRYPIGYSGHEVGLATTVCAVSLGASVIERHITLDRAMWGSDQAASVEPEGLYRLVKYIRTLEDAMGSGDKIVYGEELIAMQRLRP